MKNTEHVLRGKDFPIPEMGSLLTSLFFAEGSLCAPLPQGSTLNPL